MIESHILKVPSKIQWDGDPKPGNIAYLGQYDDWHAYELLGNPVDYPEFAGAETLGTWGPGGERLADIHQDFYKIRPLGNYPPRGNLRGGDATRILQAHHYDGWDMRDLGTAPGKKYPEDNDPFIIETRNKYFTGTWAGHGWRSEIHGDAASRDPSVRAIAWYADPQCTQYIATTGAFQRGQSEWQRDAEGNLLDVWFSETPAGFAKPSPEPWHLAVLWASVQEGYATLRPNVLGMTHLYWKGAQNQSVRRFDNWFKVNGKKAQIDPEKKRVRMMRADGKPGGWTAIDAYMKKKSMFVETRRAVRHLAAVFGITSIEPS